MDLRDVDMLYGHLWPDSVEHLFNSTSVIFKPIRRLCRSHWDLAGEPSLGASRLYGA
jgi:hypothetical protein